MTRSLEKITTSVVNDHPKQQRACKDTSFEPIFRAYSVIVIVVVFLSFKVFRTFRNFHYIVYPLFQYI